MARLPEKLSDLVFVALADLEKVEANEQYIIDMSIWHRPRDFDSDNPSGFETKCIVCLAGSVMSMSLDAELEDELDLDDFEPFEEKRLQALDELRSNMICETVTTVYGFDKVKDAQAKLIEVQYEDDFAEYSEDPERFKAWMRKIGQAFKEYGL